MIMYIIMLLKQLSEIEEYVKYELQIFVHITRYVKLACTLYIVVQLVIRQLQASCWVFSL
jgi:hypothetical protein